MIRFLIRIAIFFGSALVALWVTDLILSDFTLTYPEGLIVAAVIYALIQAILSPLIFKVAAKNASALMGGVGLISTFFALVLTVIFTGDSGLKITGATTWLLGTVLVWLITAIAGWVLPLIFLKKAVTNN